MPSVVAVLSASLGGVSCPTLSEPLQLRIDASGPFNRLAVFSDIETQFVMRVATSVGNRDHVGKFRSGGRSVKESSSINPRLIQHNKALCSIDMNAIS